MITNIKVVGDKRELGLNNSLSEVEGQPMATDTKQPIRLGFWVLVVGFGGFLAWAAMAPLDEGVSAPATVAIETHRRTIQHMTGGVVKTVLVKEGQSVNKGDILVELEDATARSNFESVRQNYMALRAAESRLLAEQVDLPAITFHADLLAGQADPFVRKHMDTQTELFVARRAALQAELNGTLEQAAGLEAQNAGYASMIESRKAQAELQVEQVKNVRELAAEGYAPRNQLLQLEQSQAELRALIADLQANRLRAQKLITELTMHMAQRRHEYHKEAAAQLAEVRREVNAGQDKLRAVGDELARIQVKSPVDGQVVGLSVSALGGVVTPGQRMMDIVPRGEALLLDARIPPQVIDRVHVGDAADVRFNAFASSPQLVLSAHLVSVSADAITEAQGSGTVSYYLGRAEVTAEGLQRLGSRALQPGMQAEVLIKTGERTLLTYLLHPLTKRLATAMKEE
jgi:protease secretion system membrane fusion protein